MTIDTQERTYRAPWLPQFGLYKYESAENNYGDNSIHVTIPSNKFRLGFLLLCGLLLIFFLITYFIIADLSRTERVKIEPTESKVSGFDGYPATVVELLNMTRESVERELSSESNEFSVEVGIETNNVTTESPNNHRKFYTVTPQKLVFLPSRTLKPPKMDVPVRSKRRGSDGTLQRRNQASRPFGHYMPEPHPAPFKHLPTRRFYGNPKPLQVTQGYIPGMQGGFRPIVGMYRRPKGTMPTYYQGLTSNNHAIYVTPSWHGPVSSTSAYVKDPFHKYKPPAPHDVNMLVADVPTREQHLKLYNDQYLKNAQALYQEVVKASRQKMNELKNGGSSSVVGQKQRPFQLMLDVYPMAEHQEEVTQPRNPTPKHGRFSPHAAQYNALNSINHEKNFNDGQYTRVRFPRGPYRLYPTNENDHLETAESEVTQVNTGPTGEHPSQLVVHLNLFPKRKKKNRKRVRRPVDYDGSDENSSEYLRRSSMESDESDIYEEDLVMTDKKYGSRPLRSAKNHKTFGNMTKNDESKTMTINFNFPDMKKNCTSTIQTTKYIPMMDGNDNDVIFPRQNIPKAHDFPYRFASMPPAHVRLNPVGSIWPSRRFQNRMLNVGPDQDDVEITTPGIITTTQAIVSTTKIVTTTSKNELMATEPIKTTTIGAKIHN